MKTFYLITNVSGLTYWSYLGTPDNTTGLLRSAAEKHGHIYVNDKGGYFTQDCVRKVHKTTRLKGFPIENLGMDCPYTRKNVNSPEAIRRTRKALKDDAAGNCKCTMTDLDSACDMLDELLAIKTA